MTEIQAQPGALLLGFATFFLSLIPGGPVLLWGGADPLLPESAVNAIARYLSNAQISKVIMPDVGHYPPLEVPDRFAQLIAAYAEAGTPNLPRASDTTP